MELKDVKTWLPKIGELPKPTHSWWFPPAFYNDTEFLSLFYAVTGSIPVKLDTPVLSMEAINAIEPKRVCLLFSPFHRENGCLPPGIQFEREDLGDRDAWNEEWELYLSHLESLLQRASIIFDRAVFTISVDSEMWTWFESLHREKYDVPNSLYILKLRAMQNLLVKYGTPVWYRNGNIGVGSGFEPYRQRTPIPPGLSMVLNQELYCPDELDTQMQWLQAAILANPGMQVTVWSSFGHTYARLSHESPGRKNWSWEETVLCQLGEAYEFGQAIYAVQNQSGVGRKYPYCCRITDIFGYRMERSWPHTLAAFCGAVDKGNLLTEIEATL